MPNRQKLTKRQKKGLAFRERKTGKRQDRDELSEMEANAIPVVEDQDIAGDDGDTTEVAGDIHKKKGKAVGDAVGDEGKRTESKVGSKGKGKAERQGVPVPVEAVKEKKRKREAEATEEVQGSQDSQPKKAVKRKKVDDKVKSTGEMDKAGKQRFLLFVGE